MGYFIELIDERSKGKVADAVVSGKLFEFKNIITTTNPNNRMESVFKDLKGKKTRRIAMNFSVSYKLKDIQIAIQKAAIKLPFVSEAIIIINNQTYILSRSVMIKNNW